MGLIEGAHRERPWEAGETVDHKCCGEFISRSMYLNKGASVILSLLQAVWLNKMYTEAAIQWCSLAKLLVVSLATN